MWTTRRAAQVYVNFIVRLMISESIGSYLDEDANLTHKMAKDDEKVDMMFSPFFREMIIAMENDAKWINPVMLRRFAARYLERIADHATSIEESIVLLVRGNRPDLNYRIVRRT